MARFCGGLCRFLARPRFFSGGCTVCLFIFFPSHSGLNRLDFFIFSFRRADGFSRPAVFIFLQRLPKRRVLFPLCLQKFSTILEKFLMARSILFLAYKKCLYRQSRAEKFFCFALPLLFRKCPDACSRPKLFLDFGTLAHIVEFFFKNKKAAQKKDRHLAGGLFGKSNVIAVLLHRS